jgi:type IV secretory pathway VirB2 component (pilin)
MLNIFFKTKNYFFFLVFSISFLSPFFANAAGTIQAANDALVNRSSIAIVLCNATTILNGTPAKIISAIMVMATGAGFLLGKIDIKIMIGVTLAVATIFGAPSIYNTITGNSDTSCRP